jgi:4-hydroxy-2-oxoheptanedioate aldolase
LVRVPWLDPGIIMKMLDAGAYGIICPLINTAEDAARFLSYCYYPPRGIRSSGPIRATVYGGPDYIDQANNEILALAMIETRSAFEQVDEILAVDGLEAIYVGPSDLALSLGYPPRLDPTEPAVVDAIDHILESALKHQVFAGIHTDSPAYAEKMLAKGFRFVTVGSDARFLATKAREMIQAMKPGLGQETQVTPSSPY